MEEQRQNEKEMTSYKVVPKGGQQMTECIHHAKTSIFVREFKRVFLLVALVSVLASAEEEDVIAKEEDDEDDINAPHKLPPKWISRGGFVVLVVALFEMFYGLATVVEEFFVPALNVMVRS